MKIVYSLLGYASVCVLCEQKNAVLNICMEMRIPYCDIEIDDAGDMRMKLKYFDYKRLLRICASRRIALRLDRVGGLPSVILRYKYRFGLMAGAVAALIMVVYFSSIIWDIRVIGNSTVTTSEIISMLGEHGVTVGERISEIDVDTIQNKIMLESDKISFIAINLSGNIASVEIRENKSAEKESALGFANVIAKKSGIIEDVRVYVGNVVVRSGQVVDKGDLLISGIYDSNRVGFRFTRAAGEIMARTVTEYNVKIPLKYEKKEYTGVVNYEKNLNFYGKTFNISKKCGNDIPLYDTIYNVGNYGLFGVDAPIGITSVGYYEYKNIEAERTPDEARALAFYQLNRMIADSDIEFVIKKNITVDAADDYFSIHCIVVSIENIAATSEFAVDIGELNGNKDY